MTSVYRKTSKGIAEIETRANRLAPRLRGALILVDGRRNADDLNKLISTDPEGTLQALLEQGYIESLQPPAQAAAEPAKRRSPTGTEPALADVRRMAVHRLLELLGPAAEGMAVRIEKVNTWGELLSIMNIACAMVRDTRGTAAALEFAERFVTPHESRG
jgi:hypothetical protein